MCQDSGVPVLKFHQGTWQFPQSTPSRSQLDLIIEFDAGARTMVQDARGYSYGPSR